MMERFELILLRGIGLGDPKAKTPQTAKNRGGGEFDKTRQIGGHRKPSARQGLGKLPPNWQNQPPKRREGFGPAFARGNVTPVFARG
jgi:hypothetical protein